MRCQPLFLLVLAACTGLSTDEKKQVAQCMDSARTYYRDGKLDQAIGVCDRGLLLDKDNYVLRSLHAAVLLRQSGPANGSDHRLLDQSLKEFEDLYDTRRPSSHDRHVLFVYALGRQKQGLRLTAEAIRAKDAGKEDDCANFLRQATSEYEAASGMLEVLLERGEMQLLCHYHLMQISWSMSQKEQVLAHGESYLKLASQSQKALSDNIDRTTIYEEEAKQKRDLAQLREEEIEVRGFLGNLMFDAKNYKGALEQVNAVLALDSTRSNDYYNRARVLHALERDPEAKEDLRKFLATTQLPANNPKVIEAVQALSK